MKTEILHHKFAYFFLVLGLILLGSLYFIAWPNRDWQRVFTLMLILFYFAWGVISHVKSNEITRQVVMEYLAAAVLAGGVLLIITF